MRSRHQRAGFLWKLPMSKCVHAWTLVTGAAPDCARCSGRQRSNLRRRHDPSLFRRPTGEKWQKRMFVAKDGYLLYYGGTAPANPSNFDTKPKVRVDRVPARASPTSLAATACLCAARRRASDIARQRGARLPPSHRRPTPRRA